MTRFAIVAGEDSGDIIGADLIQALKKQFPQATFEGIGGKRMINEGFNSLFPLERLSVMGFIEPLKRLPEIFKIAGKLKSHFIENKPDIYIGIDAPDFNLNIEYFLRKKNIKTAHYVSPTIWAWRQYRIHKIKKAVDLMLGIFPFEANIYREHNIPYCFVGHPLADRIPPVSDKMLAREKLGLPQDKKIVALLPGSRAQELKYLATPFIQTAKWLAQIDNDIHFITASPNAARAEQFKQHQALEDFYNIQAFNGQSTQVMAAADAVLLASGTASLEAMLVKRPTVVAYKMSPLTFAIAKKLVKVPYIALPNLLADKCIMPEYIQHQVNPKDIGEKLLHFLHHPQENKETLACFEEIHQTLRKNAGMTAAKAIHDLIGNTVLSPLTLAGEG